MRFIIEEIKLWLFKRKLKKTFAPKAQLKGDIPRTMELSGNIKKDPMKFSNYKGRND